MDGRPRLPAGLVPGASGNLGPGLGTADDRDGEGHPVPTPEFRTVLPGELGRRREDGRREGRWLPVPRPSSHPPLRTVHAQVRAGMTGSDRAQG